MTGNGHYLAAEDVLSIVSATGIERENAATTSVLLQLAQVHATLALVAATYGAFGGGGAA